MKLSRKLMMVSVAALMGVSPVLGVAAANASTVQAASSTVYKTFGKNSKVSVTRGVKMVTFNGAKTKKPAPKGGKYTIWDVTRINGVLYYSIQSNLAYWIPASATKGTVTYKDGNQTVELTTNGTNKFTKTVSTPVKKAAKKAAPAKKTNAKKTAPAKKTAAKNNTKSAKKTSTKKRAVVKMVVTNKKGAQVYDKNGKAVKTYMGSKKYTTIGKGVKVNNNGTKTIKGVKYYALDPNHFVKASDFKIVNK